MSDYRVKISVRNARLLRAIEQAGHRPGEKFADAVGISYYHSLMPYLNLTRSPLDKGGLLRECAWALCDYLRASPSDLWSDDQLLPLKQNHSSFDMDADSMKAMVCGTRTDDDPLRLASREQAGRILQNVIDTLPTREATVIRERFFSGLSLNEVGDQIGASPERVRQIENQALRKLRHERRRPCSLVGVADIIGGESDA